jgi:hypothetical protein
VRFVVSKINIRKLEKHGVALVQYCLVQRTKQQLFGTSVFVINYTESSQSPTPQMNATESEAQSIQILTTKFHTFFWGNQEILIEVQKHLMEIFPQLSLQRHRVILDIDDQILRWFHNKPRLRL